MCPSGEPYSVQCCYIYGNPDLRMNPNHTLASSSKPACSFLFQNTDIGRICLLLLAILITTASYAQLQSPTEFFGYAPGEKFTLSHDLVDYYQHVADNSAMVTYQKYGETNEGRDLTYAIVTSPQNHARLEQIRTANLQNAGIASGNGVSDAAIVWLSYNVHGNEASSSEAGANTLYKLITEKQNWLANTVVIIDPLVNPDGRDRYVNWFKQTRSDFDGFVDTDYDVDPQAMEHNEPWPGGRPNHYLFDLNRDWAWATQVESKQRIAIYNQWMPHIHVDFHEQGINEPYYFAPAAEPFHEVITDYQRDLQTRIGRNHGRYFDQEGWLYFTSERFDLLYPSYGDTYPTFMGAIGMTYEQAGHGRAGLGITTEEGDVLTLVDRVAHHTTTGLSTVEVASKNAAEINREFGKFFGNAPGKYKGYVMNGNPEKVAALAKLLDTHEIQYSYGTGTASGYNFGTGKNGSLTQQNNTSNLIVSGNQPKARMVQALLEPRAFISDSLTYDITAWSLPYAYGLNTVATTSAPAAGNATATAAKTTNVNNPFAIAIPWDSHQDAKVLAGLLNAGLKVRYNEVPFKMNGTQYERGTLLVLKRDNINMSAWDKTVSKLVAEHGVGMSTINGGMTSPGGDLGSPNIKLIQKPRVALLGGSPTSSLSYGEVWHYFEKDLKYPLTRIAMDDLDGTNMNPYTVLVMPEGYYGSALAKHKDKLKEWVQNGGTLIALGSAARSLAGDEFGLQVQRTETVTESDSSTPRTYAEGERDYISNLITGAIFKAQVDNTHPLGYGYGDTYFTLKKDATAYQYLSGGNTVAYIQENTPYSGFAGKNTTAALENSMLFGEQPVGQGSIVYLTDNVLFRNFWENGKLFFDNAVFMLNNDVTRL